MKKLFAGVSVLLLLLLSLSGCTAVGEKSASITIVYGSVAVLSLLLLIGVFLLVHKNRVWFILLFSSVLVVNIGYTLLSVSTCLEMALWANRVSYLGSVFLPFAMLMIILNVTGTTHPKWLHGALGALSILVFLIAASPGILPIYYKEVSLQTVGGVTTLHKVYGPLHSLYLYYLLGSFAAMLAVILHAMRKKKLRSPIHSVILLAAVLINIGVWLVEQLVQIDFEILSVSYIISELFLLGVHMIMAENRRLLEQMATQPTVQPTIDPETLEQFCKGLSSLTPTERTVFEAYTAGKTTKDVLAQLNITENTLKFHNKNIYSKLGVSSRKQLLALHRQAKDNG